MTEDEALKAFFVEWSRQASEYGGYLTCEQRDCAEEAWNAALAWLRSQGEPVAWMLDGEIYEVKQHNLFNGDGEIPGQIPLFLAPQPAIPDGWQLVPVEPTEEMCLAYTKCKTEAGEKWARHQWAAMLAAAPEPSK